MVAKSFKLLRDSACMLLYGKGFRTSLCMYVSTNFHSLKAGLHVS